MRIIFVSFIDKNETQVIHTKSDNIEIMISTDTSDTINELIDFFMKRFQEGLETKMKRSSYIFERIDLLEYLLHKISLNRGGSYIVSPKWLKNKGVTINPKNTKDNNCFQYAITVVLNHQNIIVIQKEFLNLNRLLIIIIGRILSFHHAQKTGENLSEIIRQLL